MQQQPIHTLFILQSEYHNTIEMIQQLQTLYQDTDAVLLMQDSLLFLHHPFFQSVKHLFVLQADAHDFHLKPLHSVHLIHYDDFAELLKSVQRVLVLK